MIFSTISLIFLLVGIVALLMALYFKRQGNEKFIFAVQEMTEWQLQEVSETHASFACVIPFKNTGRQDGTLMDVFLRPQLPEEQYDQADLGTRVFMQSLPRNDNYWESIIIFKNTGDALVANLNFYAKKVGIKEALAALPNFPVDIFFQIVSRSFYYIDKVRFIVEQADINDAFKKGINRDLPNLTVKMKSAYAKDMVKSAEERQDRLVKEVQIVDNGTVSLQPVSTRILVPGDDVAAIIKNVAGENIGKDDVITIAESVVAILQGRMTRPEDLRPGLLARILCRFVPQKGSLSSVYGMQACMDKEGEWKIAFGMIIGMFAKIFGKHGVFYSIAGEQPRLIDDVTGTIPPFDKNIVYGPYEPKKFAEDLKAKLPECFGVAVADVNDLKASYILAATDGVEQERLRRLLIDNPFGNAAQKTPIVIVKNYNSKSN